MSSYAVPLVETCSQAIVCMRRHTKKKDQIKMEKDMNQYLCNWIKEGWFPRDGKAPLKKHRLKVYQETEAALQRAKTK